MAIEFKDPPPTAFSGRSQHWADVAAALRERPGEWALIDTKLETSTVSNIKRGQYSALPVGQFEATSRRVDGKFDIYARYIGETE